MTSAGVAVADGQLLVVRVQIGPRMELEIVKVEEGLCSGRVLFHSHKHKSSEEAEAQQADIDERERLRAERRREQVGLCPWQCTFCGFLK